VAELEEKRRTLRAQIRVSRRPGFVLCCKTARSKVCDHMGNLPPNTVICNSGPTEKVYAFGRAL